MARRTAGVASRQRRRAREDFADRVRGCSPTLARFAFRNGGCQKQARPRQHAHEHLEKNQALMHTGPANGPAPWTVFQTVTAEAARTTSAVVGCPSRTAATMTRQKMTYSKGC